LKYNVVCDNKMSRRHRDVDRNKEFHTNVVKASITDMKKEDSHRSRKSPDGDKPKSPEVMSDNQRAISTYDKGPALGKIENKHSPIGGIVRRKRDHSTERNRAMSDEESVSSSSSSSCSSSHKRDKKRKRSSSSRKRRRKEEKRRHKASKKKKKKRSKSRDFESSTDDDDEANVRRSAITGRRIKMHVDKDAGDLVLEKARKDFLRYVNSSL
jgi:hypothetical protein